MKGINLAVICKEYIMFCDGQYRIPMTIMGDKFASHFRVMFVSICFFVTIFWGLFGTKFAKIQAEQLFIDLLRFALGTRNQIYRPIKQRFSTYRPGPCRSTIYMEMYAIATEPPGNVSWQQSVLISGRVRTVLFFFFS